MRKSQRAKYIRLKISRQQGLEIVIPYRKRFYDISGLLDKHRPWIEQKFHDWQLHHSAAELLPQHIQLLALGQLWPVNYQLATYPAQLSQCPTHLILHGNGNPEQYKQLLKQWLRNLAKPYLSQLIADISQQTGLEYNRFSIRLQSTRWGSCTRNKNISLNAKLLFLPDILVRHVIIHELCHTVHLNHSKNFWDLVGHFDQDYLQRCKELAAADRYVPAWVER